MVKENHMEGLLSYTITSGKRLIQKTNSSIHQVLGCRKLPIVVLCAIHHSKGLHQGTYSYTRKMSCQIQDTWRYIVINNSNNMHKVTCLFRELISLSRYKKIKKLLHIQNKTVMFKYL